MIHFSHIVPGADFFQTQSSPVPTDGDLKNLRYEYERMLPVFAKRLEVPVSSVHLCQASDAYGDAQVRSGVTPAEYVQIRELSELFCYLLQAAKSLAPVKPFVFCYNNCNTDKGFVWAHMVLTS